LACPYFRSGIDFFGTTIQLLPHVEDKMAHKAVVHFLKAVVTSHHETAHSIVKTHLTNFLTTLFACVSSPEISRQFIPNFALLLQSLCDQYTPQLKTEIHTLFNVNGFPSTKVSPSAKELLIRDLFEGPPKIFPDKLHSFAVLCRGLDEAFATASKPFFDVPKSDGDDLVV